MSHPTESRLAQQTMLVAKFPLNMVDHRTKLVGGREKLLRNIKFAEDQEIVASTEYGYN